jgi:hypothetical protein
MKSTLKMLAMALALVAGMSVSETAWAKGSKHGYISPSEVDGNSIQAAHVRSTGKKSHARTIVASGSRRDCGEAAQQDATMASNFSSLAGFIPYAGTIISAFANVGANQAGSEATTKWQGCMRRDMESGIAGIQKSMEGAVAEVHTDLGKQLDSSIADIQDHISATEAANEKRLIALEIAMASVAGAAPAVHSYMEVCTGCDPALTVPQTKPDVPKPDTPVSDASKPSPIAPSAAESAPATLVPPAPQPATRPTSKDFRVESKGPTAVVCLTGTCN